MTKLEAWQAWCSTAGTDRLANQFTLENSSHGKAFSFAWYAAHEACAEVCDEVDKLIGAIENVGMQAGARRVLTKSSEDAAKRIAEFRART